MSEASHRKAYKEGKQAKLDRKELDACPYRNDIEKRCLWAAGWNDTNLKMKKR